MPTGQRLVGYLLNVDHDNRISREEVVALLAEVIQNQRAEGIIVTPEEVDTVLRKLVSDRLPRRSWSPSWDTLCAIARALGNRPDILAHGRSMEMFAIGVVMVCEASPESAWAAVDEAMKQGRRGIVRAVLELLKHGAPDGEKSDEIRYRRLVAGVSAARSAGWVERLRDALMNGPWTA